LSALLQQLGRSKAAIQQEVASSALLAPEQMGSRPGVDPLTLLDPAKLEAWPLQSVHTADFLLSQTHTTKSGVPAEYSKLELAEPVVPMAYKLAGYQEQSHWGYCGSFNTAAVQQMNAFDIGADHGSEVDAACSHILPDALLEQPVKQLDIGDKWTGAGVSAPRARVWGYDDDARIRPTPIAHGSAASQASAANTVSAIAARPQLAETWRRRRRGWVPTPPAFTSAPGGVHCAADAQGACHPQVRWL
jgi:hypothetical protein